MSAKSKRTRLWWRIIGIALAAALITGAVSWFALRKRIPPGLMHDIRAGIGARDLQDPDQRLHRYLELRYGPQDNPVNRERAFMDFWNVEHIKALQLLVKHSPEDQRRANIMAMAQWVEDYRKSLTHAERATLNAYFQTEEGRQMLRQATAQYNSQDVRYRGLTAPVISQLLNTLGSVQKQ